MQTIFLVAVIGGVVLYLSKLVSFYALLSPFPGFKRWIVAKPVRLAVLDLLFGFMGLHVVAIAAGSVTAMMIMITFGACSIIYLTVMSIWVRCRESRVTISGN